MSESRKLPDPAGLAIDREIQERVRPAAVTLGGSQAAGDHRPDSDVDLIAAAPDGAAAQRTKRILQGLLEGKTSNPVVNAATIAREEFQHRAPLAQSFAGQPATA